MHIDFALPGIHTPMHPASQPTVRHNSMNSIWGLQLSRMLVEQQIIRRNIVGTGLEQQVGVLLKLQ